MLHRTFAIAVRTTAIAAALLGGLQAPAAQAQSSEQAWIHQRASALADVNPGSALVYVTCKAVAINAYNSRQSVADGLAALAACAGLGCKLTDSYNNCISVDTQLFILDLKLQAIS